MKRILSLAFVLVLLFGVAQADYAKVKSEMFSSLVGLNDYEIVTNGDMKRLGVLGLLVANEITSAKDSKFQLAQNSGFAIGVGSSRHENRLVFIFDNAKTDKFKSAYIDLNKGILYMERKDYDLNTIMDKVFSPVHCDVHFAFSSAELSEAIASFVSSK